MEFINEPFVSYFVASDYVEVVCIKKVWHGIEDKNEYYGRNGTGVCRIANALSIVCYR